MEINLLPETEKKEIKMERACQQTTVLLGLILISLFFFISILIFLNLYLTKKINSFEEIVLEREKELKTAQVLEFKNKVTTINQNLSKVQKFWQEELSIIPLIEKFNLLIPPRSIYFTSFSYQKRIQEEKREKGKKKEKKIFAEVYISGWAATREELFSFKKELEKEKEFKEVCFAPTSWVKPTNLDFSLSLKFDPFDQIK